MGQTLGEGAVQHLVLTRAAGTRPWRGEVQGWWQDHHGLSYERPFC